MERLLVLTLLVIPSCSRSDSKQAQDKLQGTWVAVSMENTQKKFTDEELKQKPFKLTFTGNSITLEWGTDKPAKGQFTIDPGKTPKTMDFTLGTPGMDTLDYKAIYELTEGQLTLCQGGIGAPRPAEFTGKSGRGTLIVLKKER